MWCRRNIKPVAVSVAIFALMWGCLHGCRQESSRSIARAFYCWKTTLAISSAELAYMDALGCNKLYLKVLDIGRDPTTGAIQPYSRIEIADTTGLSRFQIVQTVFITNEVFNTISEEKIEWLARKVAAVAFSHDGAAAQGQPELQFDCDWTASTREAFFLFLKKVKKHLPENTRLSATIRLHQYKFPRKTGVPPVERGMLMFYNTGDIEDAVGGNSIFQPEDARKYLIGAPKHYPLPLDLALPIFSWALVYRDGELWKIIPEMPESELNDPTRFEAIHPDASEQPTFSHPQFRIQKGTFISGHYLRPGDLLRVEAISPGLLMEAARLAASADLANDATLAFFHLDTATIRHYPVQLLDSVCLTISFPEKKK